MGKNVAVVLGPPVRVVPHTRPLLFHEGRLYCSRFDRIVSTPDFGETFVDEAQLALELPYGALLRTTHLGQRIARACVYRMRALPNGNRVFVFRGGIYVQVPGWREAYRTFPVRRGSRPVSLAIGGDGLVVFGEYWGNKTRESVHIYGSRDGGVHWKVIHTFLPGEVLHVHGISYDRYEDAFWICTGDYQDQCRLLRASPDFCEVTVLRQGGQSNRFYFLLVTKNELVTATDAPSSENYICAIDKRTGELRHLTRVDNSTFHCCFVGQWLFTATNAEASAVNDVRAVHVWAGRPAAGDFRRVLTLPIDLASRLQLHRGIPRGLFQIPQLFFPEGENAGRALACHVTGLSSMDDAMICWDTAPLETLS